MGGSRSLGSINTLHLALGVNRGFAAMATDNGRHGYAATDISWALGHPERIADFGYRAHHLDTETAKLVIHRFYNRAEARSYFLGCSQGGFLGMLAAQHYPADLTPGSESTWSRLWDVSTTRPTSGGSWLGTYRNMVFDDPTWDPATLSFDRDPDIADRKLGAALGANAPNLEASRQRGGKLIIYHGWADHMVPAQSSTDYYASVLSQSGQPAVDTFLKLFMGSVRSPSPGT